MRDLHVPAASGGPSHATKSKRSASMMTQTVLLKCLAPQQPVSRSPHVPPLLFCCASALASFADLLAPPVLQMLFAKCDVRKTLKLSEASLQELLVVSSTRVRRNPLANSPSAATCNSANTPSRASNDVRLIAELTSSRIFTSLVAPGAHVHHMTLQIFQDCCSDHPKIYCQCWYVDTPHQRIQFMRIPCYSEKCKWDLRMTAICHARCLACAGMCWWQEAAAPQQLIKRV